MIFWNSGTEPIRRHDVIEPMLLSFSARCNLLKASVLKSSGPQNRVILNAVNDTQQMHVDFEYLEPRQGFNVELLVTGETTDGPIPTGTIIGMPNGFQKFDSDNRRTIADIVIIVGLIVVVGGFFILRSLGIIDVGAAVWVSALSVFILAVATLWASGMSRRQGIPPDLRT